MKVDETYSKLSGCPDATGQGFHMGSPRRQPGIRRMHRISWQDVQSFHESVHEARFIERPVYDKIAAIKACLLGEPKDLFKRILVKSSAREKNLHTMVICSSLVVSIR